MAKSACRHRRIPIAAVRIASNKQRQDGSEHVAGAGDRQLGHQLDDGDGRGEKPERSALPR